MTFSRIMVKSEYQNTLSIFKIYLAVGMGRHSFRGAAPSWFLQSIGGIPMTCNWYFHNK